MIPKKPVRLTNRNVHTHTTMSAKKNRTWFANENGDWWEESKTIYVLHEYDIPEEFDESDYGEDNWQRVIMEFGNKVQIPDDEPEQQQEIDNNHEPVTPKGTPITVKVRPRTKKTQPGYRSSDGDYFGKYCGDIYGCGDVPNPMRCKCVRCNPIYYWTKKRQPSRPDHPMVAEALAK